VFETFRRSVPPRLASLEPAFCGELAFAAPAKLDATSRPTPTAAITIDRVSLLLCISVLPSTLASARWDDDGGRLLVKLNFVLLYAKH
jgi:hypothetical protein